MRALRTILVISAFAVLCAPAIVHAQCAIDHSGVFYDDSDCDGVIDYDSQEDANHDGIPDGNRVDNCRTAANGDCDLDKINCDVDGNGTASSQELAAGHQLDWDKNGIGDACDDHDFDGVKDYLDNCRSTANPTQDPNACVDTDHDGFEDPIDNCPLIANQDQLDSDGDGVGDWCDNCRRAYNPTQNPSACPDPTGITGGGSSALPSPPPQSPGVTPDINAPGLGPEQIQGNGFGEGGCSLIGSGGPSLSTASIGLLLALLALRRQRSR